MAAELDPLKADEERRKALAEDARKRFIEDFQVLAERADFRRWLFHVIDSPAFCRAHGLSSRDTHTGELIVDPVRMYEQEGRRGIGVRLMVAMQQVAPQRYVHMLTEQMGLRSQQVSAPVEVTQRK